MKRRNSSRGKPVLIAACSCGVKLYNTNQGWLSVEIHSLRRVSKGLCQWVEVPDVQLTRELGALPPFNMGLFK